MDRIHFHESFYQDVLLGRKVQTARIDEPHYPLGKAMADFSNGLSLPIEITNVSFKTIDNMSLEEAQRDGFESKESLWKALMGFYPNLKVENSLMLVEFRCIVG
ncbi:ASCH domain-containing protein [Ancylomarina sp. 16SWW S1-10-2]|uniref:ASCH domain-containing protein n=1 Tax=Ancylomarina sp. 16SWW S1-10-2 TaxID=2499681 RepID=UPI0012ADAB50|nr:ASCH domain-containing protein [Ancylomarina sp. 16SWW S1-10-2]MRT92777.1 ASCH domain-containing protein [Ancylomarina sp. 16SWW S1-10-2]